MSLGLRSSCVSIKPRPHTVSETAFPLSRFRTFCSPRGKLSANFPRLISVASVPPLSSSQVEVNQSHQSMDIDDSEHHAPKGVLLSVLPHRFTKTVHLIRHGEGFHNVAGIANHDNYQSEEWFDAHLTEKGWDQAEKLNKHIKEQGIEVDVVIVAPLTRALETAVGAFSPGPHASSSEGPALMEAQDEVPMHRVKREAASSAGLPKFVAWEPCREILGQNPCDRRRETSYYRKQFPFVDFSLVTDEEDQLWHPEHRESREDITARGLEFFEWLSKRPEKRIAVVSHSTFLHFALRNFGEGDGTAIQGDLHRWFENCELRSVVLVDRHTQHTPPCDHHFPGGHHV